LKFTSESFDDFVAERSTRISDFDTKKEQTVLQNSRVQYLPFFDKSGRRVFVGVVACNYRMISAYISLRFRIHRDKFHWIASKDIESHRKSAVFIIWPFDEETDGTASWQKSIIRP